MFHVQLSLWLHNLLMSETWERMFYYSSFHHLTFSLALPHETIYHFVIFFLQNIMWYIYCTVYSLIGPKFHSLQGVFETKLCCDFVSLMVFVIIGVILKNVVRLSIFIFHNIIEYLHTTHISQMYSLKIHLTVSPYRLPAQLLMESSWASTNNLL